MTASECWTASASSSTEYSGSSSAELNGAEDNLLIPTTSDICRTFHDGRATWANLMAMAGRFPTGHWPTGSLDPYTMLMDVPSLPMELPRRKLLGRPLWRVTRAAITSSPSPSPSPRPSLSRKADDDLCNMELIHGQRLALNLETESPILCDFSPQAASCYLGDNSKTTDNLAILTLCWSYILSVSLLERQGRKIKYSPFRLRPVARGTDPSISLQGASVPLTRWLCAVLSPELGWSTLSGKGFPPWTASLKQHITIVAAKPVSEPVAPPNAAEATELLLELCDLFGLGTDVNDNGQHQSLPPYTAGLFAALMLPFYRFTRLRPQFKYPALTRNKGNRLARTDEEAIRHHVQDLRYFSTLSMLAPSLGSVLWSMFWQPDVDCNLVSPWLASIIDVLEPVIAAKDLETLLKIFTLRRSRVAPWWIGLFLLGDITPLDWIRRYAKTSVEQYGTGTPSHPDPVISAWTGSPQSFLDYNSTDLYLEETDQIPRADILRGRFNLKLQGYEYFFSWRPFGNMKKQAVELDLWPYLETGCVRHYHSFTWYTSRGAAFPPDLGFRQGTGRNVTAADDLRRLSTNETCQQYHHDMKLAPSKRSTLKMMSLLVEDATGGQHWPNAAMPGVLKQYPWLRYWRGLEGMDSRIKATEGPETIKAPSWLLLDWIGGDNDGGGTFESS